MAIPDNIEFDLGQRLKLVRELNGLSQRELARRAGVTNSNISMIEQGAVSPSVSSLARLLDAIPLSLTQFFACDPSQEPRAIYRARDLRQDVCGASGIECAALPSEADGAHLTMRRYRLAPGSDSGPECRSERVGLVGWLVEGELELSLGARVFALAAGDGFYLPASQPYRVRNAGTISALVFAAQAVIAE
ncbi:helix-turn-helix domain-containing protein [Marinimicrobium sp. ABcell2]|uniref:helix-turn-helix domain-containing protein n=1 Tax=Marinimicrobium sp. ABcell2 TaxID=3069751 RepID=UPI0027B190A2|nr:helix-turn-helix domain-containing protein [Marinimicrobium sp. ABcell2]MDQ2075692.1 helix-turn-helix domain-containing protein [Marinimicrobium sp. ABcell2]